MPILLADRLIQRFQAAYTKPPDWAWPFKPPIPFVGRRYKPGRGLLVYASAENLSWLHDAEEVPWYFDEPEAWNRYRMQYDADVRDSHDHFFPDVGIQPVTDGGLFAAALFVADQLGLPMAARPRTFLERIAVSNWCKFTIKAKSNRDYICNLGKLTESLPFVVAELVELRPAVVLLPRQLWRRRVLRAAMTGASPWSQFRPVPQFNATVVNVHLAEHATRAVQLRQARAGTPLAKWMANLVGFREENAWRYIAFLDGVLRKPATCRPA